MTHSRKFLYTAILLLTPAIIAAAGCAESTTGTATATFGTMEQQTHKLVNDYRQSRGLPPLVFNETIAQQARQHSIDMGGRTLNHDGFDARVTAITTTIKVSSAAENVALNNGFSDPAQEAVTGWINSTPHRINMEGDFDLTGIGIDKESDGTFYFTQIFIKKQ